MRSRKPNRLKDYDYSQNGYYFLSICSKNREEFFGKIENEKMVLTEYGNIVKKCWLDIPNHFPYCMVDEFIIMPNHIHGILIIDNPVGNNDRCSPQYDNTIRNNDYAVGNNDYAVGNNDYAVGNNDRCSLQYDNIHKNRNMESIPKIISQYKSSITREIRKNHNDFNFGWQKSYYEHIIRNEKSLYNIRKYIINNPINWNKDENNLINY